MNKLKAFIDNLAENLNSNKSFFYYLISATLVIGLLFFISSKSLFDKNKVEVRSTNLNEMQTSNTLKSKIISRKYNPLNKMIEFIVYAEDGQNFDSKELVFELREQQSPNMKIETRYQKVDNNYYIIFAKVPKKWKVLSLSMGYENTLGSTNLDEVNADGTDTKNNNNLLSSVIRIYSDSNDIDKDNFLKEKKSTEYFSEIIDLEVQFITKEIQSLDTKIEGNNSTIKDAEGKIKDLKDNKKYQTESEQNSTELNINKLNNLISTNKSTIENDTKSKKELKDKINKLKQKRSDFKAN